MNRREWLQVAGAAIPGVAALVARVPARRDRLERIGLQLYTVRGAMGRDFEGTLARVAETGYQEVEFAGYFERHARAVRTALDAAGLDAPSAHITYESLGADWPQTLDDAHTIGHRYLVVPWIPAERRSTLDGYRRVAELFNRAGEAALAAGIQFAYHNHSYEFPLLEGRVPYDVLAEATDPRLVQLQLDLYWAAASGGDPLAYFVRWPGRFSMVHVKDMDGTPAHGMVDVGKGVLDFKRILAQRARAGIRHFFVEHDNPDAPFDSIRASYTYLKQLEF